MDNKFIYDQASLTDFKKAMDIYGWVIYENAIAEDLIYQIISEFENSYQKRRSVQVSNGIQDSMAGTLHHLLERENFSLPLLNNMYCDKQLRDFLGGNYILNGINGVSITKSNTAYINRIHRDVRTFSVEQNFMIQMIIPLDDFVPLNGATYFLSGSHKIDVQPSEEYFNKHAIQAVAKKGSIILFNSNLWHAAGTNFTDKQRRALTLGFTKPYVKQQFDYPRFLGYEFGESLNNDLRQVIGYNARVPASLEEYYMPKEKRMYQADQG